MMIDIQKEDYDVGDKVMITFDVPSLRGMIGTVISIEDGRVGIKFPDNRIMFFGLKSSVVLFERAKEKVIFT